MYDPNCGVDCIATSHKLNNSYNAIQLIDSMQNLDWYIIDLHIRDMNLNSHPLDTSFHGQE